MYVYMKTARNYKKMTVSFWVVSDENCAKSKIWKHKGGFYGLEYDNILV